MNLPALLYKVHKPQRPTISRKTVLNLGLSTVVQILLHLSYMSNCNMIPPKTINDFDHQIIRAL